MIKILLRTLSHKIVSVQSLKCSIEFETHSKLRLLSPLILLLLLAGKPVEGERNTYGRFLFLFTLLPVQLPLYTPGLDQEERGEVVKVSLGCHGHNPPWDGKIPLLTPSFDGHFCEF